MQVKNKVIPAMKKALIDAGEIENDVTEFANDYFIGQGDKAFLVGQSSNVIAIEDFHVNTEFACTISACLHKYKDLPIKQRLQKTAQLLQEKNSASIFPWVVMDTKNQKVTYIDK